MEGRAIIAHLMQSAARQYAVLFVLVGVSAFVQAGSTRQLVRLLGVGAPLAAQPFSVVPGTRTVAGGQFKDDELLAIDGAPFHSMRQYAEAVGSRRPGDSIKITLSERDGRAVERDVVLPDATLTTVPQIAVSIALNFVIPVIGLALGLAVVLIRPMDRNAWLVLFLMTGFTETVRIFVWEGPDPDLTQVWSFFWKSMWPVSMMYFGIYFPSRSARDRSKPWIKYVALALFLGVDVSYFGTLLVWQRDVNAAQNLTSGFRVLYVLQMAVLVIANAGYFANFRRKSALETSADGRRRLSILRVGSSVGLVPMLLVILWGIFSANPMFVGVPWPLTVTALLLLTLFPLTLAYVIIVEHAMNLGFVIRMGIKYAIAKSGFGLARATLVGLALYIFWTVIVRQGITQMESVILVGVSGALLLVRRQGVDRVSLWLDRQFFREAYDSEKVLAGLASEVGRYLEIQPLFERVALRLGETLHVNDIVILMREGNVFRTRHSTRAGEPMDIAADSRIAVNLEQQGTPVEVYFDTPAPWMRLLTAEELQTLDFMRTQLLLPLSGRNGLVGMISLGPKRSEIPYSDTDVRLLQAVAWQTGMALENSRLLASLAEEAAQRERLNLELEIAREVQERLFPQKYPEIAGITCAGYCRPARGVGGDYYDFLKLPDGKLGMAIGDVSGKGIGAALLMAGLQASLRGQAIAGRDDLASLMGTVNRLVYEASTSNRYATFFYAEYYPADGNLVYVNAGHNPPFVLRGTQVIRLETGGPVVGLLPGAAYEQGFCPMHPGDVLLLYTDGMNEAQTEGDEEWGDDRFIAAATDNIHLDPARMIEAIFAGADAFTGNATQFDDMTLVVVKISG